MATQEKFVIEYGLTVGSTEVITSAGKIVAAAISTLDTDDLTEGSTNLYYADSKVTTHLADASEAKTLNNVQLDGGSI